MPAQPNKDANVAKLRIGWFISERQDTRATRGPCRRGQASARHYPGCRGPDQPLLGADAMLWPGKQTFSLVDAKSLACCRQGFANLISAEVCRAPCRPCRSRDRSAILAERP
jgi:hypothetical protein